MDATRLSDPDDTTPSLLSSAVGDRCSNCGVPLASDQRYCVNCGTRRGKPRYVVETATAKPAPAGPAGQPSRKRRQPTTAMTVIGFIGVLLLAMGVGVLIGHDGNSNSSQQAAVNTKPIVVNVGSAGAAAASSAPTTASTSSGKKSKSGNSGGTTKNGAKNVSGNNANGSGAAAAKHIDKKTAAAASNAAAKALGSGPVSNPTVQPGQSASGPGTQNGKFTGTFFPGGQ